MKLSHVLLALGAVASVGEARFSFGLQSHPDCEVGEVCGEKSYRFPDTCDQCVDLSDVDDRGFVRIGRGRGYQLLNPETGERCYPGPDDGPVCRCGPTQTCTKGRFRGCAINSCKSARLRRNLGRWDWYNGKTNKVPPLMKYVTSERAEKNRMMKLFAATDGPGTILAGGIVNALFDEDEENDLGWNDSPSHTRPHMPTGQSVGDWINFRL